MASSHDPIFEEAGRAWNVDPDLLRAVAKGESGAQGSAATSPKGAAGIMQLMPDTARGLGVTDVRDPAQNIFAGAKYLSSHLDATGGNVPLSLKMYQGGPNQAVWGRENAAYPSYIMARYQPSQRQDSASVQPAAASGRDSVINSAVDRARQGATRAVPSVGYDAPEDVLLDSLTGGAKAAPASSGQAAPDLSDDALLERLTTGAKSAASAPVSAVPPSENPAFPDPVLDTPPPAPNSPSQDAMVRNAATGVGNVLSATGQGFVAGFGPSPLGLAPNQQDTLRRLGVIPSTPDGGTLMQRINNAGIGAAVEVGNSPLRAVNGLLQGYQRGVSQAGAEVGQPQLGRDLAALPEAFPTGFSRGVPSVAAQGPEVANRLAGQAAAALPLTQDAMTELRLGGVPTSQAAGATSAVPEMAANRLAPAAANQGNALSAPRVPVTAEPLPAPQAASEWRLMQPNEPLAPGQEVATAADGRQYVRNATAEAPAPGQPGSMGAAATPGGLSNLTPEETQAYRSTAEGRKLLEPQPSGKDLNRYIEGVDPTLAQTELDVNTSRELKALGMTSPAISKQAQDIAAEHNVARGEHMSNLAGSPVDVRNAQVAADARGEANRQAAWQNKTNADLQPMYDAEKEMLGGEDGRRPAVRKAIASAMAELKDSDGKLITDPELLYGVRKHFDDLLADAGKSDSSVSVRAKANILQLKSTLDGVIEKAAPGFGKYLSEYHADMQGINEMKVLQEYEPKLYNAQNQMEYSRVQSMMKRIIDSRMGDGINDEKSISDGTMGNLFALRDDLRRAATEKQLAKAPGSDTTQNFMDVARLGGAGLLHAGIASTIGPFGNMALGAVKTAISPITQARAARKQAERGNALLQPDRTAEPLRNPLAGP